LLKWAVIGFALFVFLLLAAVIRVLVEFRIGVEDSGLRVEVTLGPRLFRKELSLEELITGLSRGGSDSGRMKAGEAETIKGPEADRPHTASRDIRRQLKQGMMLRREIKRRPWLSRMTRSAVEIRIIRWRSVVGLDDAMHTALTAGTLWIIKGWILALLSCLSRLHRPQIEVIPAFDGRRAESTLHCEISLRLAYLVVIMPAIYFLYRRTSSLFDGSRRVETEYATGL